MSRHMYEHAPDRLEKEPHMSSTVEHPRAEAVGEAVAGVIFGAYEFVIDRLAPALVRAFVVFAVVALWTGAATGTAADVLRLAAAGVLLGIVGLEVRDHRARRAARTVEA